MGQSSAIRVLEQSPARLVLYEPPYWPFAFGFLAAGVLIAGLLFLLFWKLDARPAARFTGCVLALPFLFFGIQAVSSKTIVELSARDRTLTIEKTKFFLESAPRVIEFDQVLRVVELQARRSYAVGLVLRSGETIPLTRYGDQPGKPLMIAAMDQFLAKTR